LEESIQPEAFLAVQAERLRDHIGDVRGARVLDLGIGKGILLEQLRASEPAGLTGVDIALSYMRRFADAEDVDVVFANAENLPFREHFDLVVAADVVEHVINVADLLVGVHEALAPNGRFLVRVPYREDITQHSRLRGCPYEFVHLRTFAKDNLTDMLLRAGFRIDAVHYDGFDPSRARAAMTRTRGGRVLWRQAVARLFGGEEGVYRMNAYLGRLLMTPIVITVVARKG
jgi:SAM-dependent methyltransferase